MAPADAELGVVSPESTRSTDDPTVHSATTNAGQDFGPARARLLKCLFYLTLVLLVVSVASIIVGILALAGSDSRYPYVLGGGIIAGGMALLLTICPFCMFCERKKIENKLTCKFRCCVKLMAIWYALALCGILSSFAIPGFLGVLECVHAEQKIGYLDINPCLENTSSKLTLSVATFVLCGALLVLTSIIVCFTCRRAFGYKSKWERQFAYYERTARPAILRELEAERNRDHRHDVNDRRSRRPRDPNSLSFEGGRDRGDIDYHRPGEPSAPPLDGYSVNRDRSPYSDGDYHRPSAPPLENRDRRPNDNHARGDHRQDAPRRPNDNHARDGHRQDAPRRPNDNHARGDHRQDAPRRPNDNHARDGHRRDAPRRPYNERRERKEENEAPPPSYDEVLRNELKEDVV